MKKSLTLLVAILLIFCTANAQAKSSRKGFYIGFAPQIVDEVSELKELGAGFSFQIGGGFNEHWILYADLQGHAYDESGATVSFSDMMVKGQYVPNDDVPFFVTFGIGSSTAHAESGSVSVSSDTGFGMQLGGGYEWRTGEKFFMAPELFYNYRSIESTALNTIGVSYRFGWYF